ncbi:MAG: hypothetical protein H6710_01110 [Myxococcales bacterium]|nr:hypothetical protein [Myxococcales bacterium]
MTRATFGLGRRPDLLLATLTVALAACNGDDAATASESATGGLTSGVSATTSASTSAGTMSASDSSSGGSGGESMTSGSGGSSGSSGGSSSTSAGETSTSGSSAATITDGTTTDPGPVCGNGIVEDGEACDDGDNIDNNACSNACTKVPCDQQEGGNLEDVLSYIWISNSSQATVSKINTKTAIEEGRYRVQGGSPSRTSVNLQGDVAVSSRDSRRGHQDRREGRELRRQEQRRGDHDLDRPQRHQEPRRGRVCPLDQDDPLGRLQLRPAGDRLGLGAAGPRHLRVPAAAPLDRLDGGADRPLRAPRRGDRRDPRSAHLPLAELPQPLRRGGRRRRQLLRDRPQPVAGDQDRRPVPPDHRPRDPERLQVRDDPRRQRRHLGRRLLRRGRLPLEPPRQHLDDPAELGRHPGQRDHGRRRRQRLGRGLVVVPPGPHRRRDQELRQHQHPAAGLLEPLGREHRLRGLRLGRRHVGERRLQGRPRDLPGGRHRQRPGRSLHLLRHDRRRPQAAGDPAVGGARSGSGGGVHVDAARP